MTDNNMSAAQTEAFLNQTEEMTLSVVLSADLNKIRDLPDENLTHHFTIISDEALEERSLNNPQQFKDAIQEALFALKALINTHQNYDDSHLDFSDLNNKEYFRTLLSQALSHRFEIIGQDQGYLRKPESSPEIELAKSFNKASEQLEKKLRQAFQDKSIDRLSESQISSLAESYGQETASAIRVNDQLSNIFSSILATRARIALHQMHAELNVGRGSQKNLNIIIQDARDEVKDTLFKVSEEIGLLPKSMRSHPDISLG